MTELHFGCQKKYSGFFSLDYFFPPKSKMTSLHHQHHHHVRRDNVVVATREGAARTISADDLGSACERLESLAKGKCTEGDPVNEESHWVELVAAVADRITALAEHVDALHEIKSFGIDDACRTLESSDIIVKRLAAAASAAGKTFVIAARAVLSDGALLSERDAEHLSELAEEAVESLGELARLCQHLGVDGLKRAAVGLADAIKVEKMTAMSNAQAQAQARRRNENVEGGSATLPEERSGAMSVALLDVFKSATEAFLWDAWQVLGDSTPDLETEIAVTAAGASGWIRSKRSNGARPEALPSVAAPIAAAPALTPAPNSGDDADASTFPAEAFSRKPLSKLGDVGGDSSQPSSRHRKAQHRELSERRRRNSLGGDDDDDLSAARSVGPRGSNAAAGTSGSPLRRGGVRSRLGQNLSSGLGHRAAFPRTLSSEHSTGSVHSSSSGGAGSASSSRSSSAGGGLARSNRRLSSSRHSGGGTVSFSSTSASHLTHRAVRHAGELSDRGECPPEQGTALGLRIPTPKHGAINVVEALTEAGGDWDLLTACLIRFAELAQEQVDVIWGSLKSGGGPQTVPVSSGVSDSDGGGGSASGSEAGHLGEGRGRRERGGGGGGDGGSGKPLDYEALLAAVDCIANGASVCHATSLLGACEKLDSVFEIDRDHRNALAARRCGRGDARGGGARGDSNGSSGGVAANDRAAAKARAEHYAELVSDLSEWLAAFETQAERLSNILSFPPRDLFHASSSSSSQSQSQSQPTTGRPTEPASSGGAAVAVIGRLRSALELLYDVYGTAAFVLVGGADAADAPAPVLKNRIESKTRRRRLEGLLDVLKRGEECCVGLGVRMTANTIRKVADLVNEMIQDMSEEDAESAATYHESEARSVLATLKADIEEFATDIFFISSKDFPLPNVAPSDPAPVSVPVAEKGQEAVSIDSTADSRTNAYVSKRVKGGIKDNGAREVAGYRRSGSAKKSGDDALDPAPTWLRPAPWLDASRESVVSLGIFFLVCLYIYVRFVWTHPMVSSSIQNGSNV